MEVDAALYAWVLDDDGITMAVDGGERDSRDTFGSVRLLCDSNPFLSHSTRIGIKPARCISLALRQPMLSDSRLD